MADPSRTHLQPPVASSRVNCPIKAAVCPTPEQLSDFCRGVGDIQTAEQLADVIDRCSACESYVAQCEIKQAPGWQQLKDPLEAALDDTLTIRSTLGRKAGGSDTLAPGDQIAKYQIVGVLGRGGMGIVYRAHDPTLGRSVALKTIRSATWASAESVAMFVREAHAAARLEHAGIVPVFDIGVEDDLHYLTMQLIDGPNLADAAKQQQFNFREIADVVRQIAEAVVHAHSRNIVHRDLKPQNILLAGDGVTKVTDFGLAKQLDHDDDQTRTGELRGTPSYMAPEQAGGDLESIGYRTDVYAIGAILYFLLTGRAPFVKDTIGKTLQSVIHDEPRAPIELNPRCPKDLATISLKCLSKSPSHRYDSATALSDDLNRYLSGTPIQARPVSSHERAWRWCVRNPIQAALASITIVLVLAMLLGGIHFAALRSREVADNAKKLDLANRFDDALAKNRVTTTQLAALETVATELSRLDPQRSGDRTNRLLAKAISDATSKLGQPQLSSALETEIAQRIDWLRQRDQAAANELSQRLEERRRSWRALITMADLIKQPTAYLPAAVTKVVDDRLVSKFPLTLLGASRIPMDVQVPRSLRVQATFSAFRPSKQFGMLVAGKDSQGNRAEIEFLIRRETRHIPLADQASPDADRRTSQLQLTAAWTHPAEDALAIQPAFAVSPDGRFMAFADGRHAIKVVNVATGDLVQRVDGLTDAGFAPVYQRKDFLGDESALDRSALNPLSNPLYELIVIGIAPIRAIRFTPDGQQRDVLSLGQIDDKLAAVSVASKQVAIIRGDQLHIQSWQDPQQQAMLLASTQMIAISPEGGRVAYVSDSGGVFIWNLDRPTAERVGQLSSRPEGLHFFGDGRVLLAVAMQSPAVLIDVDTGVTLGTSPVRAPHRLFMSTQNGDWQFSSTGGPGVQCFDHLLRKVGNLTFQRDLRIKSIGAVDATLDNGQRLLAVRLGNGDVQLFHWHAPAAQETLADRDSNPQSTSADTQWYAHIRHDGVTIRSLRLPQLSGSAKPLKITCVREPGRLQMLIDQQQLVVQDRLLITHAADEQLAIDLPRDVELTDFLLTAKTEPARPSLLEQAEQSWQQLDYQTAADQFQQQIQATSEPTVRNECKFKRAQCLRLLGQTDQADRLFSELVDATVEPWSRSALVQRWLIAIDNGSEDVRAQVFAEIRATYEFGELAPLLSDAERHRIIRSTPVAGNLPSVSSLLRHDPLRTERLEQSVALLHYLASDTKWRYADHEEIGMQVSLARAYQMEDNLPKALQILQRLHTEQLANPEATMQSLEWITEEYSRCLRLSAQSPGDAEAMVFSVIKHVDQGQRSWKLKQESARCLARLNRHAEARRSLDLMLLQLDQLSTSAHVSLALLGGALAEHMGDLKAALKLYRSGADRFKADFQSIRSGNLGLMLRGLMLQARSGDVNNDDFFRVANLWFDPDGKSEATSIVNFAKSLAGSLDFGAAFDRAWQSDDGQRDFLRLATDDVSLPDRYRLPLVRLGLELTDAGAFGNQASDQERQAILALMNLGYEGTIRQRGAAAGDLGGAFAINFGAAWKLGPACQFMLATGLPRDDRIASGLAFVLGARYQTKGNRAVARQAFNAAIARSPDDWPIGQLAQARLRAIETDE